MKLSPNFSLAELTITSHGRNDLAPGILERLRMTACHMEVVRFILGMRPLQVTSAYRNPQINAKVGGSKTSDHMSGWAVDFKPPGNMSVHDACLTILASDYPFDQLIQEPSWVHISFAPGNRRQVLTAYREGGTMKYRAGLTA